MFKYLKIHITHTTKQADIGLCFFITVGSNINIISIEAFQNCKHIIHAWTVSIKTNAFLHLGDELIEKIGTIKESVFLLPRVKFLHEIFMQPVDLVPRTGIKPGPPAMAAWSPSHWTTSKVLARMCLLKIYTMGPKKILPLRKTF